MKRANIKLDVRRDLHLLTYAYSLSTMCIHVDKRNLPTKRHIGKRLIVPRSLKPIVLRCSLYRLLPDGICLSHTIPV